MKIKSTSIKVIKKNIAAVKIKTEYAIRVAVEKRLKAADKAKRKILDLPFFDASHAGIPAKGSAKIAAQAILKYLRTHTSEIKSINICLSDAKTFTEAKAHVNDYLNYMIYKMQHGPYVTVDMIIERPEGIVFIERLNPPYGWALPGGFVDDGESLEHAAAREAKEETDLKFVNFRQLKAYSDPKRDPRFHTIAVVFAGQGKGVPKSGDDAGNLQVVAYNKIKNFPLAFDHKKIVMDYLKDRHRKS